MRNDNFRGKVRFGFVVFGGLMVLEIAEYTIGTRVRSGAWPYLGLLAVIGAWPIFQFFMHILDLRRPKE